MRSPRILVSALLLLALPQAVAHADTPWRGTAVVNTAQEQALWSYLGAVGTPAYYFASDAQKAAFDAQLLRCNVAGLPQEAIAGCAGVLGAPGSLLAGSTSFDSVAGYVRDTAITGTDAAHMTPMLDLLHRLGAKKYPGNESISKANDEQSAVLELTRADALATVAGLAGVPASDQNGVLYTKDYFTNAIRGAGSAAEILKLRNAALGFNQVYAHSGELNVADYTARLTLAPSYAETAVVTADLDARGAVLGATHLNAQQKQAALDLLNSKPNDPLVRQQVVGFDNLVARAPEFINSLPKLDDAQRAAFIGQLAGAVSPSDIDAILNAAKAASE